MRLRVVYQISVLTILQLMFVQKSEYLISSTIEIPKYVHQR